MKCAHKKCGSTKMQPNFIKIITKEGKITYYCSELCYRKKYKIKLKYHFTKGLIFANSVKAM